VTTLLVVVGGAAGANLRYLLDRRVQRWHDSAFPWGTLTVNVLGCLVLGLLTGAARHGAAGHAALALLGTGLCGALTTYSTFGYETIMLFSRGARLYSVANVVISVLAGLGATGCGLLAAAAVWG
jgi:CrcB protein